ncbi:DsrE family protein [Piscinibacter sakaiensis]|uniref:DsrE family protein n=1 Tax=Piscinibacter sakaiensis TaxID=1547922 RepID=UPI003AB078C9
MKPFRRFWLAAAPAAVLSGLALGSRNASAQAANAMPKAVWHVDFGEPRRLSAMIQNVNNMVTTYQNDLVDYDVRIVFLAAGIRFITEDALAGTPFAEDVAFRSVRGDLIQRLLQLRDLHKVKLEYCELTAELINLPKPRIVAGIAGVRSGVVRIAELQSKGFAYLKAE